MNLPKIFHQLIRHNKNGWGRIIHQASVRDWRFMGNEGVPFTESDRYRMTIETSASAQQYAITCVSENEPQFGLDMYLEINRGVPCLHVSNAIGGDNVLHLFFTEDGIVVVPEVDTDRPVPFSTSHYYPGIRGFSSLYLNPADTELPTGLVA